MMVKIVYKQQVIRFASKTITRQIFCVLQSQVMVWQCRLLKQHFMPWEIKILWIFFKLTFTASIWFKICAPAPVSTNQYCSSFCSKKQVLKHFFVERCESNHRKIYFRHISWSTHWFISQKCDFSRNRRRAGIWNHIISRMPQN